MYKTMEKYLASGWCTVEHLTQLLQSQFPETDPEAVRLLLRLHPKVQERNEQYSLPVNDEEQMVREIINNIITRQGQAQWVKAYKNQYLQRVNSPISEDQFREIVFKYFEPINPKVVRRKEQ